MVVSLQLRCLYPILDSLMQLSLGYVGGYNDGNGLAQVLGGLVPIRLETLRLARKPGGSGGCAR